MMGEASEKQRFAIDPNGSYKATCYFRNDDRVDLAIRSTGGVFKIFFGLRRYGKTWFLRHVEEDAKARGLRTLFVNVPEDSPQSCAKKLESFSSAMEQDDRQAVILIDDLEMVDGKDGDAVRLFAFQLGEIVETWKLSRRLRIVLCEPTNFPEWLEKETGYGPMFADLMRDAANFSERAMLSPLDANHGERSESFRMLSSVSHPIEPELSDYLANRLGGNPWMLAYATTLIETNGWTATNKIEAYDGTLNKIRANKIDNGKLETIYDSLSSLQQFFLRIILTFQKDSSNPKIRDLFRFDPKDQIWKDKAKIIARMMEPLGLARGSLDNGFTLSTFMYDYLLQRFPGYSLFNAPLPEDKLYWRDLLKQDPPESARDGKIIIHQISDIFLSDDDRNDPQWNSYTAHLAKLHAARISDDHSDEDERPDFIIICGNIAAVPAENDEQNRMPREKYAQVLRGVERRLYCLLRYLRPGLANKDEGDPKQIVILPGVFDLRWDTDGKSVPEPSRAEHREEWQRVFRAYSIAGDQHAFLPYGLTVLAFDTTSLNGASEHGGKTAVGDLMQVRKWLQDEFRNKWDSITNFPTDPSSKELAAELSATTLGYILDATDRRADFKEIDDPTFKWKGTLIDGGRQKGGSRDIEDPGLFLSDTGFVSERQRKWTKEIVSADNGLFTPIVIAVTHHHPNNPRRSGVIEFFNESRFREDLARAGVQTILHGRSSRQQILTQTVSYRENGVPTSPTIDLIGSGSFSHYGGVSAIESPDRIPNASFNEIVFTRSRNDRREPPDLQVTFWEFDAESACLIAAGQWPK